VGHAFRGGLTGVYEMSKKKKKSGGPRDAQQKSGAAINIASNCGVGDRAPSVRVRRAKAGVVISRRRWRLELGPHGIL